MQPAGSRDQTPAAALGRTPTTAVQDWAEPGVYLVAEDVYRIPLPLVEDGLRAVNVYALLGADRVTVIDSGWASADTLSALDKALRFLGAELGDIGEFLITHAHWDHYTQALQLRDEFDLKVRLGAGERHSIEAFDLDVGAYPVQVRRLEAAGASQLARRIRSWPISDAERDMPFGPPDVWLADGATVETGARSLEVLATPGHTRGHVVFRDAAAGLLFSGDHVLPHITPSIGLERAPERYPLRSYLSSLRLVRDLADAVLLPAHGHPQPRTHERVDDLLAHHEARFDAVVRSLRAGATTAYQVAARLPWTSRGRRLHQLDLLNQMMAVLEIQAHLDVLLEAGAVQTEQLDGTATFTAA